MESKANYTIVGLVVLILVGGLLAAALWLSVGFDQKKYNTYAVYIHESVSGLTEESQVKFNGVRVGYVWKIELNRYDPQQVRLLLKIEEGTPITTSTTATLISQGITGTNFLGLSASSSDLTPLKKLPGQPYPVIPSTPSLFNQLDRVLKEVAVNVNAVSLEIKRVFDKENAAYIKKTLANLQDVTDVVAKNSKNIDRSLRDLPVVMKDLKTGLRKFNNMADEFTTASQEAARTMRSGKSAIDKISQQTLPPAVLLLRRLDIIAGNLEKITSQMRYNPSVIFRGTTPPKPGPGE